MDISASLAAPQVVERNDYLPYGMRLGVGNTVLASNRYHLGGKEEQVFGGLDLGKVDFGARQYDPFTAGWTTIDPMAEKYGSMSPYGYCAGNPVNIVDPDGNDNYQVDSYGYVSLIEKTDDDFDRLYAHFAEIGPNLSFLVEDRSLLPTLAASGLTKNNNGNNASFTSSNNKTAITSLFKYMADNTEVEWVIHKVDNNYTLGTIHRISSSGSYEDYGIRYPNASIHSHPNTDQSEELYSMGYRSNQVGDVQRFNNESQLYRNQTRRNYVYFPESKNVYQVIGNNAKPRLVLSAANRNQLSNIL